MPKKPNSRPNAKADGARCKVNCPARTGIMVAVNSVRSTSCLEHKFKHRSSSHGTTTHKIMPAGCANVSTTKMNAYAEQATTMDRANCMAAAAVSHTENDTP